MNKRMKTRNMVSIAMLSAVAACALVISCGIFAQMGNTNVADSGSKDYSVVEDAKENVELLSEIIDTNN